jgi:hypothetical protein
VISATLPRTLVDIPQRYTRASARLASACSREKAPLLARWVERRRL